MRVLYLHQGPFKIVTGQLWSAILQSVTKDLDVLEAGLRATAASIRVIQVIRVNISNTRITDCVFIKCEYLPITVCLLRKTFGELKL